MRESLLVAACLLSSCGSMPDRRCIRPGEMGIVTRVVSKDLRGGTDWFVAFKDAGGMTRVCSAGAAAQALRPGDRIAGTDMWK